MPRLTIHSLFCALRPPPAVARDLWAEFGWLRRGDDRVEPERMHVTLAPLGAWRHHPERAIAHARSACARVTASAFRVVFDDLIVGDRILLRPSEPIPALCRFRTRLMRGLAETGLRAPRARTFSPHLTTSYRTVTEARPFLIPVSWVVTEFVLIESLIGERTQIERGRWPLIN